MKAVILPGELGTRIGEETSVRPKPMVEIGGRPIIWQPRTSLAEMIKSVIDYYQVRE